MIAGKAKDNIQVELCERDAFIKALHLARAEDIVVVFYEDYQGIMDSLSEMKALLEGDGTTQNESCLLYTSRCV